MWEIPKTPSTSAHPATLVSTLLLGQFSPWVHEYRSHGVRGGSPENAQEKNVLTFADILLIVRIASSLPIKVNAISNNRRRCKPAGTGDDCPRRHTEIFCQSQRPVPDLVGADKTPRSLKAYESICFVAASQKIFTTFEKTSYNRTRTSTCTAQERKLCSFVELGPEAQILLVWSIFSPAQTFLLLWKRIAQARSTCSASERWRYNTRTLYT